MNLIERLLQTEPQAGMQSTRTSEAARRVVRFLLDESPFAEAPICEASVHRPTRSRVWVATFTGPTGGQIWRSTGLASRDQALLLAKRWESEARAQRAAGTPVRPKLRVGRREPGTAGPLTQKEIAQLLNISERAVRLIERRAIQKLFNHPALRQVWRKYLAGELDEDLWNLTQEEINALLRLARTAQEWLLLRRVTQAFRR
jgi:hypothetical protein